MPVTYLPRRRRLPANDPPGFTPSYHHTRFDPADSNHDRRAARTRLQPLPTGSRVKHLSTIDSTLFHGFSGKCHFYAILSTNNPIHVSTRASTLPLTHDETGSARHTHSLARSPKATDSLLLTRRHHQNKTKPAGLTLLHTTYSPGRQLRRTSRLALAPVRASTHNSSTKTLPAGLTLLHST